MARKVRLEFPGAVYHVLNRGNYREGIFSTDGARAAFESCLSKACEKSGWVVHAYCLMSNHYHLALETPEPNLVAGMTWLQSTFANRFNRYRNERGHVFQGRYKAILVEGGEWLGNLCHYIHLNPVRAKLCNVTTLKEYRSSSYHWLFKPKRRPAWLSFDACLDGAGGLADTSHGRRKYMDYLDWLVQEDAARKKACFDRMSRGWALGTLEFRKGLIQEHRERLAQMELGEADAREVRELQWEELLRECLRLLGKGEEAIARDRKSAAWKVAVAAWMKERTQASNVWLTEKLNMGHPNGVSRYVGLFRAGRLSARSDYHRLMTGIEV